MNDRTTESGAWIWIARAALLAWLVALALGALDGASRPPDELSLWHVQSRTAALAALRALALAEVIDWARFVPLGALAVFSLPTRSRRLDRALRVWLPALALSALCAVFVRVLRNGSPYGFPGSLDLVLPLAACLVGTWAGMAWRRGALARLLFVPELALVVALLVGGLGLLAYLSIDRAPLPFEPAAVNSDEKRRLYHLFAGKNPLKLAEGAIAEMTLTTRDLDLLLSWGLSSLGEAGRKAEVQLDGEHGRIAISVPVPAEARYFNLTAAGKIAVDNGKLRLEADELRLGRVAVPRWLVDILSPVLAGALNTDRRIKPLLAPIHQLEIAPGELRLRYGRGVPPKGFVADLFHGDSTGQDDIPFIRAHVLHLIDSAKGLPADSDARFGVALSNAFRFARERSQPGTAVQENRGAVLALGIVVGHPRVETFIGNVMDDATRKAVRSAYKHPTLRQRDDWPKHFFVSASLTLLSLANVSDATGLFKEEKDAGGGSGFSFGDLLADRAGTTFAEVATRDDAAARALQDRLSAGFHVDDFFPPADGLPENMQDAEFKARYGGVGGAGYNALRAEIERRIAACAAYQKSP